MATNAARMALFGGRLLLIGESRPDGTPGDAFEKGTSASRLFRLFGVKTRDELLEIVDVVNWADDGEGWESADMGSECLAALECHKCVVLLGREVQQRFRLKHKYYVWDVVHPWYVATMPHTSAKNKVWNDPTAEQVARVFLEDAVALAERVKGEEERTLRGVPSVMPNAWAKLLSSKEKPDA